VELSLKQQMELGITYANSILKNFQSLEEAMEHSYENLVFAAFNFAKTLKEKQISFNETASPNRTVL
ncbi:MAG: hypothetical protein AAGH81_19075, partial [Bacteroidota bacterium]